MPDPACFTLRDRMAHCLYQSNSLDTHMHTGSVADKHKSGMYESCSRRSWLRWRWSQEPAPSALAVGVLGVDIGVTEVDEICVGRLRRRRSGRRPRGFVS